jgi:hypothetical protein
MIDNVCAVWKHVKYLVMAMESEPSAEWGVSQCILSIDGIAACHEI